MGRLAAITGLVLSTSLVPAGGQAPPRSERTLPSAPAEFRMEAAGPPQNDVPKPALAAQLTVQRVPPPPPPAEAMPAPRQAAPASLAEVWGALPISLMAAL